MISSKQSINRLAYICHRKGIKDIVFSAGSRNAPVIIAFVESGLFNCYSIPDERAAAFVAMGMAQASGKPTLICCTSGSAAANYTPAICEAYYQGIPLIVLTADRPVEMIDQGAGQSIRQFNMYRNFIKASFQFEQEALNEDALDKNDKIIQQAIHIAEEDTKGPVHINLPFEEPLYETNSEFNPDAIKWLDLEKKTFKTELSPELVEAWKGAKRKMILFGMALPDTQLMQRLESLCAAHGVVLLTETCSNILIDNKIECIDRVITTISDWESYQPDILVTMGGPVISKKIKKHFLNQKPKHHWDIYTDRPEDTFLALKQSFEMMPLDFIKMIEGHTSEYDVHYVNAWKSKNEHVKLKHQAFLKSASYSDLTVFSDIIERIPSNAFLHLANSTPVRYAQLFEQRHDISYLSNRGVSGIDGCSSTALGYALNTPDKLNILITGDLAFFYDSNAFFHQHLPTNLKIILINNGGGGIFRIIEGPSSTNALDKFFESQHSFNAKGIAQTFDLDYRSMDNSNFSGKRIKAFLEEKTHRPAVLEILTPNEVNDKVLRDYFQSLL
ncbi:MAG: 2-succinyl-5-enolpyruvyl-6-hydroxy-3-cyclohexene-1-carboxylic-acid synthase [Saprospiraceae bacterium]|nr:2-succinyl-5-enolpyruvyl-6-hydroxy-3-cyclohexene-1-carboxylic-acid synthase [Saprospiraceae bacterium]